MIFLSNENLVQINSIFGEYMHDKYNIDTSTYDDLSEVTPKFMKIVAGNAQGVESIKDLNILVLGQLRRYYLSRTMRDKEIHGNRKVVFKESMPIDAGSDKKNIDLFKKAETLEARRNAEFAVPRPPEPDSGVKEVAENMDDFLARVKELEKERETEAVSNKEVKNIEYLSAGAAARKPLPIVNVNKNLRVAKDNLVSLNEGYYYIKCLSVKYNTEDFDHIIAIKISETPVVFKMTDYSLVGDKSTVMYEPILSNDKVNIDPSFVCPPGWISFTIVVLKAPN